MRKNKLGLVLGAIAVAALTIARIILAYKTGICPNTDAVLDDMLFMDQGMVLWSGDWLGPYGALTLAKNPGYGLLLALFRILGMRYQLGFVLLLCFASAIAAQALRPLVPSRAIRATMYVALIYMPLFFTSFFFQRVYRNGAAAIVALLLFSSFVGLYLRRRERLRTLVPWSVLTGVSLGFFSIIQESAAWVLPFAGACTAVMVALAILDVFRKNAPEDEASYQPRHFAKEPNADGAKSSAKRGVLVVAARLLLMVLPLALYGLTLVSVSSMNQQRYGVSLLNDKYQGEFARATADIMRIDAGHSDQRVWICNDALDAALAASPTLAKMEPELRKSWEVWQGISAGFNLLDPNETPQILGDHPYWALRDAYDTYGGYKDAREDERYWGQVANEVEAAFQAGTLKEKTGVFLSQTTQPMEPAMVPTWALSSFDLMGRYAWGDLLDTTVIRPLPDTDMSGGAVDAQLKVRELLGYNTLFRVDGEPFDDHTSELAQPWLKIDNLLGRILLKVRKATLVLSLVGLVVLLVADIRARNRDGIRSALILLGMYLSAFVLVFAASWMISFLSTAETAVSAANPAFSYCAAIYVLIALGECLVLGRVAQMLLERVAIRRARAQSSDGN